jgi:UDP-N-acetylglucosamine 2-epimerase (non-hydrolysing)
MIDVLVRALALAQATAEAHPRAIRPDGQYAVATLHRPANVDDPAALQELVAALIELSDECEIIFPVHPRTRARMATLGSSFVHGGGSRLRLIDPLGYPQMANLVAGARLAITDSGGLQEETTYLGVPCLTVRTTTERPITCTEGTNRLVSADRHAVLRAAREALAAPRAVAPTIERWDGHAAERIADVLCQRNDAVGGVAA